MKELSDIQKVIKDMRKEVDDWTPKSEYEKDDLVIVKNTIDEFERRLFTIVEDD